MILFVVGYGGSFDEVGEIILDVMVMDGVCCVCMFFGIIYLDLYCGLKIGSSINCESWNLYILLLLVNWWCIWNWIIFLLGCSGFNNCNVLINGILEIVR